MSLMIPCITLSKTTVMMKSITRIGRFSDFKAVGSTLWESSKLPFATAAEKQLDQINIKG